MLGAGSTGGELSVSVDVRLPGLRCLSSDRTAGTNFSHAFIKSDGYRAAFPTITASPDTTAAACNFPGRALLALRHAVISTRGRSYRFWSPLIVSLHMS